ncbi:MAG: hypothetical protein QN157_09255 [Armatimonadota bacterium]|nr:hypothetical protein [Armatimonadota bacterium]
MTTLIFPKVAQVTVALPDGLRQRLETFAAARGWGVDEAARLLLAYAVVTRAGRALTPEETVNSWSAARAELALLRHRAYLADDAARTLRMNVTGLEASNTQYRRSLPAVEAEVARLEAEIRDLEAQCIRRGLPVPAPEPVEPPPAAAPLDFFRRTRAADGRGDPGGGR